MQMALACIFIAMSIMLLRINEKWKWPLALAYMGAVVYLTVGMRNPTAEATYSAQLGDAIREAVEFNGNAIKSMLRGDIKVIDADGLQFIILNVLFFIPVGIMTPLFFRKADNWFKVALIGFGLSFVIEAVQLCTHLGYAEVDDLLNNTIGTVVGWIFYLNFIEIPGTGDRAKRKRDDLKPIQIRMRERKTGNEGKGKV